jgi:hypothetical protein
LCAPIVCMTTTAAVPVKPPITHQPPQCPPTNQPPKTGKEYLFISNVDNLGATVDLNLLYHLVDQDIDFCTCAVDLTRADSDGGVVVNYKGAWAAW